MKLPVLPSATTRRITPTDVSQFVRLEQCERFLRLRLAERAGHDFMEAYGVTSQRIAPLMSLTGQRFEEQVETALTPRFRVIHFARQANFSHARPDNNTDLLRELGTLGPGETVLLLQTRLQILLEGWLLRGDVDLLKCQRLEDGSLDVLITDLKSTAEVKVEHRLQVAFYHLMLERLFQSHGVAVSRQRTAVLFRGLIDPTPEEKAEAAPRQAAALVEYQLENYQLEIVADQSIYNQSAYDLLLGPESTARRIAESDLDHLPYCLSSKCDGCLYTEFCMKSSAETEDLSLLPYLSGTEKEALRRGGVTTIQSLATLKQLVRGPQDRPELIPTPGREMQIKQLAATWPVGPRLDELIHRARAFRKYVRQEDIDAVQSIPGQGNSSLPSSRPDLNPNLIWLYLDAQHDPLENRVYLLGALVVACKDGEAVARRWVVHLTEGPPNSSARERKLYVAWSHDLLQAVLEVAQSAQSEPGEEPTKRAPIHIVFFDRQEQRFLLEGLARNFPAMLERTPPLYDFLTQLAPYDSPLASFLDEEVRTFKNFPMTCQSLQSLATFLKFDWNTPYRFRELFKARLFDYLGKLDLEGTSKWYIKRARFGSAIPTEYAYAAWGALPTPREGQSDEFADFRPVTRDLLLAFEVRRLEAMEQVASAIPANRKTQKTPFHLPQLADYEDKARDLAHALDEFLRIERIVGLADWKAIRHVQPEQRVLMGECLLVRYSEADQEPEVAARNRENERRRLLREAYEAEFRANNPEKRVNLSKQQRDETAWSPEGLRLRLRIETEGLDCDLDELLLLSTLRDGEQVVVYSRWTEDERLPLEQRSPFTPTPKQLIYGQRAELVRVVVTQRDEMGKAKTAFAEVILRESRGSQHTQPFVFGAYNRPLLDGELYTLDPCPNEWYAYWCAKVVEGLCQGQPNELYHRLIQPPAPSDGAGSPGQQAFLAGLQAFHRAGLLHDFEASKREFIGGHATTPLLLVQGPPGTGKSYSTAFAVFARLQEAMRQQREYRVFLSCKTHAATDVLLQNLLEVRQKLSELHARNPALFERYFDRRLLEVPLYRIGGKNASPEGILTRAKDSESHADADYNVDVIGQTRWAGVGITPGGTYSMLKSKNSRKLFGQPLCDLLVLDEASQMNLPEALMAALPLKPNAPVIVVGDHRQMPPIVKHDWDAEARRTFRQYQAYRSLFDTLRMQDSPPPIIRFSESFRLHRAMANFLREEIYYLDGIAYHSRKEQVLPTHAHEDDFVEAVLDPNYPLIVIVHQEMASQVRNPFEQRLIGPIILALTDSLRYALDAEEGLGVVVPHRAQRAALQQAYPQLSLLDPETGLPTRSAVDTVERFQGGERTVVLVSATESDRGYLLESAGFLLDPRRLTVAISRAKQKMILVASQSVFTLFSPEEETFTNARLWKNLLRRTCTHRLWNGTRENISVTIWGGK